MRIGHVWCTFVPPDGSKIAYWFPRDGDFNNENEVFVTSAAGGGGTDLTRALDRNYPARHLDA